MIRLKDIAEVCGVSVATVSRALNGVTNENKERTAYICQ
nr:helix-turn-helix domain-containing protein [Clostridium sp.]